MNRVIMFIAVLTVALVLGGYNGRAATYVGKPASKTSYARTSSVKYNPTPCAFILDAEDADDLSVHFILGSGIITLPVYISSNSILETRKAVAYPLPIFIVQHRLLI